MLYVLILTTYISGVFNDYPAVSQSSTPGFTTEEACKNAGEVARSGAPKNMGRYNAFAIVTYQCAPLSI